MNFKLTNEIWRHFDLLLRCCNLLPFGIAVLLCFLGEVVLADARILPRHHVQGLVPAAQTQAGTHTVVEALRLLLGRHRESEVLNGKLHFECVI